MDPPITSFRTLGELEEAASRRSLDALWAYIQGGASEERTLRANRDAFRSWGLKPRVLADVSSVDLHTEILGARVGVPFWVAPMAYQGQVHPEGEVAMARAAGRAHVLGAYSTLSSRSLEEIAAASGEAPRWFQLYLQPDFEVSRSLIERAERARFSAIVLTVDTPVLAVRDRQSEGGFAIDGSIPIGNGRDVVPPTRGPVRQGELYRLRSDAGATWEVVDQIRSVTRLPVVLKGVLDERDAREAARRGVRGIVVSNHGGRQLDGAVASLEALPAIVAAVGSSLEVYLDGGVRRASDILIALALGARAVGIGRPLLWALAADGEAGVERYFSLLATELATSMALSGRRNVAEVDRTLVERTGP